MKRFILLLLIFSAQSHAQNELAGVLHAEGGTEGVDWVRPSIFTKPIPDDGEIKLQSRFIWDGDDTIAENDHAVVAFSQGFNNHWNNSLGEHGLLQYGVGAHVSHDGLSLELWFNPDNTYHGSAYVWNSKNMCGIGIGPQAIPYPQLCLSTSSASFAYVTPRPSDWNLEAGRAYWVRVKIKTESIPDWYTIEADLIDPSYTGWLIQQARLSFRGSDYFPLGSVVDGTLGRAAGNADINFVAFDDGF